MLVRCTWRQYVLLHIPKTELYFWSCNLTRVITNVWVLNFWIKWINVWTLAVISCVNHCSTHCQQANGYLADNYFRYPTVALLFIFAIMRARSSIVSPAPVVLTVSVSTARHWSYVRTFLDAYCCMLKVSPPQSSVTRSDDPSWLAHHSTVARQRTPIAYTIFYPCSLVDRLMLRD